MGNEQSEHDNCSPEHAHRTAKRAHSARPHDKEKPTNHQHHARGHHSGSTRSKRSGHVLNLTGAERQLIKNLWQSARSKGKTEPGKSIFKAILFKDPQIAQLFDFAAEMHHNHLAVEGSRQNQKLGHYASDMHLASSAASDDDNPHTDRPESSDRKNSSGRRHSVTMGRPQLEINVHAARFTKYLDMIVKAVDDQEAMDGILLDLGSRHSSFNRAFGFKPKVWDTFAEAMVERTPALADQNRIHRNAATQNAWAKLVVYIIERMKDGYYEELTNLKRIERAAHARSPSPSDVHSPR